MGYEMKAVVRVAQGVALAGALIGAASAQDSTVEEDSLCRSGAASGNAYDGAALAPLIAGEWVSVANGTGFTLGTNTDSVAISYDPVSQGFFVQSPDMPRLALNPIASLPADAGLSVSEIMDGTVSYTVRGVENGASFEREVEATSLDLMTVAGCTFGDTASFWWEVRLPEGRFANGMIMFVSGELGLGFMQNSAGGSRSVVMLRP